MNTILAIDDDPVFLAFLEKALAGGEHRFASVTDPTLAVEQAESAAPDLIVLDVEMPQMNGLEVFEALKTNPLTEDIPVWMCTSVDDEGMVANAYELGVHDYVTKPISAKVFRAKVDRFMRKGTRRMAHSRLKLAQESLARADTHIRSLLPKVPNVPGLEIGLQYRPHDLVGGDFYDFFVTARNTQVMLIGDVTGHGVEAAVIQTMARKLIQMCVRNAPSIEEGLLQANTELKQDLPKGNFVAILLAEWYPAERRITFFRLGLPHPLIRAADGSVRIVMSGGTILGMHPTDRFERFLTAHDTVLEPGDLLLFHTDGAIEAPLPTGNDFGFEGLRAVMKDVHAEGASGLSRAIYDAVATQVNEVDDDITFLVCRAEE